MDLSLKPVNEALVCEMQKEGALGFSVLWIWPTFGVLHGLRVFSSLVFGFQFLSTMMAVFRISLSNAFYGFSGFAKEFTPYSRAKIAFPRDHLYSVLPFLLEEKWMTSLVRLANRAT